ncbi:MAG: hypothetical protein KKC20_09420 [Proteobacteria bacterium]|nr:hypothetical protein [Pseudomonadota bacterium]
MIKRRDFIKLMGGALGAVALTSCRDSESSDEPPIAPIPNGYIFYKIISSEDNLPDGNILDAIPGTVMLNDANEVFFYGVDQTDTNGFYELLMDFNGSRPTVERKRKVIREGDVLKDAKVVSQIKVADTNGLGSFATTVLTDDNYTSLYLEREKQGLEPVAGFLTPLPGGGGKFGANFGDLDLHNNNDILIVSHYSPSDTIQGHQGLFYLPGGEINQQGRILTSTRDQIPGTDAYLAGIGLIDMHDNGNYIMQTYGFNTSQLLQIGSGSGSLDEMAPSMLMSGNASSPASMVMESVSPALPIIRTSASSMAVLPTGAVKYGPRIGASNNTAFVYDVNDNHQVLHYKGKRVVEVGSLTPLGNVIVSFSAPVVGSDGLLYYQASTDNGLELMIYNGSELRTILATDDLVDGSVLKSFFHGFLPDQVDSSGRIVFTGDFEDGSTSIVIGIPI